MMNWRGSGKKRSWFVLEFVLKNGGASYETSADGHTSGSFCFLFLLHDLKYVLEIRYFNID
jgi:hypothetical protein